MKAVMRERHLAPARSSKLRGESTPRGMESKIQEEEEEEEEEEEDLLSEDPDVTAALLAAIATLKLNLEAQQAILNGAVEAIEGHMDEDQQQ